MIIDCHTHLGRNEHINATADQLLKSMDEAKVDKALVFAGMLNDCSNEWLLDQVAGHTDRLLAVAAADAIGDPKAWISRIQDEAKQIANWYGEGKIVACKFYTGYHHYYPYDRDAGEYIYRMEQVGCPAIFHSGDCLNSVKCAKLKFAHPLHIDELAVNHPSLNIVIAHMGYPWVRDAAEVCYKNANVFSDMSGFVYGKFEGSDVRKFSNTVNTFLDIANNDNLLFGSDWPICDQSSYMETVATLFEQSLCPAAEYLTQNTKRAFNLK